MTSGWPGSHHQKDRPLVPEHFAEFEPKRRRRPGRQGETKESDSSATKRHSYLVVREAWLADIVHVPLGGLYWERIECFNSPRS